MKLDEIKEEIIQYQCDNNCAPYIWVGADEYIDVQQMMATHSRRWQPPAVSSKEKITVFGIEVKVDVNKDYRGMLTIKPEALKICLEMLTEEQLAVLLTDNSEDVRRIAEKVYRDKSKASGTSYPSE